MARRRAHARKLLALIVGMAMVAGVLVACSPSPLLPMPTPGVEDSVEGKKREYTIVTLEHQLMTGESAYDLLGATESAEAEIPSPDGQLSWWKGVLRHPDKFLWTSSTGGEVQGDINEIEDQWLEKEYRPIVVRGEQSVGIYSADQTGESWSFDFDGDAVLDLVFLQVLTGDDAPSFTSYAITSSSAAEDALTLLQESGPAAFCQNLVSVSSVPAPASALPYEISCSDGDLGGVEGSVGEITRGRSAGFGRRAIGVGALAQLRRQGERSDASDCRDWGRNCRDCEALQKEIPFLAADLALLLTSTASTIFAAWKALGLSPDLTKLANANNLRDLVESEGWKILYKEENIAKIWDAARADPAIYSSIKPILDMANEEASWQELSPDRRRLKIAEVRLNLNRYARQLSRDWTHVVRKFASDWKAILGTAAALYSAFETVRDLKGYLDGLEQLRKEVGREFERELSNAINPRCAAICARYAKEAGVRPGPLPTIPLRRSFPHGRFQGGTSPSEIDPSSINLADEGEWLDDMLGRTRNGVALPECEDPTETAEAKAGVHTDPHVTTLDGLQYGFQGAGEYVLFRSNPDDDVGETAGTLEVQSRFEPVGTPVSVSTAVAIRLADGPRITVAAREQDQQSESLRIMVDDEATDLEFGQQYEVGPYTIRWAEGVRPPLSRVTIGLGEGYWIVVSIQPGNRIQKIGIGVPATVGAAATGLLGSFDGDPANDLRTADGRILDPDSLSPEVLYRDFGEGWRVKSSTESIFSYVDGQGPEDFWIPSFPSGGADLGSLNSEARRAAFQACWSGGIVVVSVMEGCLVDVGFSGDRTFVDDSLEVQATELKGAEALPLLAGGNAVTEPGMYRLIALPSGLVVYGLVLFDSVGSDIRTVVASLNVDLPDGRRVHLDTDQSISSQLSAQGLTDSTGQSAQGEWLITDQGVEIRVRRDVGRSLVVAVGGKAPSGADGLLSRGRGTPLDPADSAVDEAELFERCCG